MALPIPPQYLASGITIQTLEMFFNPVWDGAAWVVDPDKVEIRATVLLVDGAQAVITHTAVFPFLSLPAMGQTRVNNARNYFEQRTADSF